MAQNRSGGCLSWVALGVALLALLVGWTALRRTGGSLADVWRRADSKVESRLDDAERQADLLGAKTRLLGRRAEVAGNRNLEQVRREVAEVRESLRRAYRDASAEAKTEWRRLDRDLAGLEDDLREGGAEAVSALNRAIARIEREVKEGGGKEP